MDILLLEDDPQRILWFQGRAGRHTMHITQRVAQAIDWCKQRQYDLICLDHDLADHHYEGLFKGYAEPLESTGYDMAQYLAGDARRQTNARILVHSVNLTGAIRMTEALKGRRVMRTPFTMLRTLDIGDLEEIVDQINRGER